MLAATRPWFLVAFLALLLGIGAACGSAGTEGKIDETDSAVGQPVQTEDGVYFDVSPQELKSMLGRKDFLFINVHIPYEGEIEGTDLFLPYDEIGDRLGELPSEQDAKIVVYCRSGGMSATAAATLVRSGYTNIWNLDGGMIAWKEAGYPLVNAEP